jgi:hypothetical protein
VVDHSALEQQAQDDLGVARDLIRRTRKIVSGYRSGRHYTDDPLERDSLERQEIDSLRTETAAYVNRVSPERQDNLDPLVDQKPYRWYEMGIYRWSEAISNLESDMKVLQEIVGEQKPK